MTPFLKCLKHFSLAISWHYSHWHIQILIYLWYAKISQALVQSWDQSCNLVHSCHATIERRAMKPVTFSNTAHPAIMHVKHSAIKRGSRSQALPLKTPKACPLYYLWGFGVLPSCEAVYTIKGFTCKFHTSIHRSLTGFELAWIHQYDILFMLDFCSPACRCFLLYCHWLKSVGTVWT